MQIVTNNVPRDTIEAYALTAEERKQFDYLDWQAIEAGRDSGMFFRYKGTLYDLGEFSTNYGITKGGGLPAVFSKWDAYMSDSAFSGMLVLFVDDYERVVIGRVFS